MEIDKPSKAHAALMENAQVITDLRGGLKSMRNAGRRWLPSAPKERPEFYDVRLARTFLFEAYKDTVRRLAAKPFAKKPIIPEGVPAQLERIEKNADGLNGSLAKFLRCSLVEAMHYGEVHAIVDFPNTEGKQSFRDEVTGTVHPYFSLVPAPNLIRVVKKDGIVTEARIKTQETVFNEQGDDEVRDVVTVWKESECVKHVKVGDAWQQTTTAHTFGAVPLVSCEIDPEGPPMLALANANVEHWQIGSDYRNTLWHAGCSLLYATEWTGSDTPVIAPGSFTPFVGAGGKLAYAETSGAGLDAQRTALRDLEERMVGLGLAPLMRSKSGGETATGKAIDQGNANADLLTWTESLEVFATELYRAAAKYVGAQIPADWSVKLFTDFGLSTRQERDIEALLRARAGKEISRKTFLAGLKARGVLDEALDIDEELADIDNDDPPMKPPPEDDDDDGQ